MGLFGSSEKQIKADERIKELKEKGVITNRRDEEQYRIKAFGGQDVIGEKQLKENEATSRRTYGNPVLEKDHRRIMEGAQHPESLDKK